MILCSASDLTRDIEARIIHAKETREWEMSYMTYRDYYAEEFAEAEEKAREQGLNEGLKEGHKQGLLEAREEFAAVSKYLLSQKRYADLERASDNSEFYDSIIAEMRDAGKIATQP